LLTGDSISTAGKLIDIKYEQICCTERHMDEKAGLYTAGFFCRGTFEIPIPQPSQQKPTPEPTTSGTRLLATPTTVL
jgi:hypothetical protein